LKLRLLPHQLPLQQQRLLQLLQLQKNKVI
jgi:hypothetical protein